jgi:hypothetical protein
LHDPQQERQWRRLDADQFQTILYARPARKHFRWRHGWAVRSRSKPLVEVAGLLQRRFKYRMTY